MTIIRRAVAGAVLLAGSVAAAQAALDTAQPMICAASEVIGCAVQEGCVKGPPDAFNLPVLLKVDVSNQQVESIRSGGARRSSTITSASHVEGATVLLGADGAAGWSATINATTGAMTVASSRDGVAFSVFGTCAAL